MLTFELKGAIKYVDEAAQGYTLITTTYQGLVSKTKGNHMAYQLQNGFLIVVRVDYVDADGNPASVDSVKWDTSNATILSVTEDSEDPQICTIETLGPLGQAQVTATADADLGSGVKNIVSVFDVTVVAGEAVAGTITPVGEAEPIAPHPEPQRKK